MAMRYGEDKLNGHIKQLHYAVRKKTHQNNNNYEAEWMEFIDREGVMNFNDFLQLSSYLSLSLAFSLSHSISYLHAQHTLIYCYLPCSSWRALSLNCSRSLPCSYIFIRTNQIYGYMQQNIERWNLKVKFIDTWGALLWWWWLKEWAVKVLVKIIHSDADDWLSIY